MSSDKNDPVIYGDYSVVEAPESVKLVVRGRYPLVTPINADVTQW